MTLTLSKDIKIEGTPQECITFMMMLTDLGKMEQLAQLLKERESEGE